MPASKAGAKRRQKLNRKTQKQRKWADRKAKAPVGPLSEKDLVPSYLQKQKWPLQSADQG